MTMDLLNGGLGPKRGDRLRSPKTTYYVLGSRKVNRRDPSAPPRYQLWVEKLRDIEPELRGRLLRSACRRGGSFMFEFTWYPRKKKSRTFEDYMRLPQMKVSESYR